MMEHFLSSMHSIGPMDIVGPIVGACVFITLMSLLKEPARHNFNAILVAGAGAAYFNGGLGPWEYLYTGAATIVAYYGLKYYKFIALAWVMHTCWDVVHHLYGTPIWPWMLKSSMGCAIFDFVIAIWFFWEAPTIYRMRWKHLLPSRN